MRNLGAAKKLRSRRARAAGLPPGPALPTSLQAAIWALRPLDFLDRCERDYGELFTLRIRRARPWVLLSNPEQVKQVFTTSSSLLGAGAGEATRCSGRCSGPRSVMLLDEPQHLGDRKRLLPVVSRASACATTGR